MLLGYLMNDLLREYVASGEFTRRGKWLAALREAAMFYVPALLIGMGCASALPCARPSGDPRGPHCAPRACRPPPPVAPRRRNRHSPPAHAPRLPRRLSWRIERLIFS